MSDDRTRSLGKWLIGSGVTNTVLLAVIAVLGLTVFRQVHIIDALASGVSQQRDQFTACKNKPATTEGCTTPVAAEPSVIVKQGKAGPIGATGIQGPQGPAGPQGPIGPVGKPGIPGDSPKCLLLVSACSGPQGPRGDQGPVGPAGEDGERGPAGADGAAGVQGPEGKIGVPGPKGVGISSTQCVDADPPIGSQWLIVYTDGTQEKSPGPCRIK